MVKKVVLTGGSGFIGSALVKMLLDQNFEVHVIIRSTTDPSAIHKDTSNLNIYTYDGSISNLTSFFKRIHPNVVIHLSSKFVVDHNDKDVDELVQSNLLFGLHLLEAMKQSNVKDLVNTGTSWQHFNDEDYNPVCLYAATKQAFESLLEYYVQLEDFRVVTLKLFDTYGEFDTRSKLFNILKNYSSSEQELSLSPGDQFLNLVHVDDVCRAFILSLSFLGKDTESFHRRYLVRSPVSYSLKEVVDIYKNVTGSNLRVDWGGRPYRRREVMVPTDNGVVLPNWSPLIDLETGLRRLKGEG